MKIYLDESGDLGCGKGASKYFLIVLVVVKDEKDLEKIIRKIRINKLNKGLKKCPEIKANNSNDKIRIKVLKGIAKMDVKIYCHILDKSTIHNDLKDMKEKIYNDITVKNISKIPFTDKRVELIVDRCKSTKKRLIFDSDINNELMNIKPFLDLRISHLDSKNSPQLQAVDFIAWSILRKYERKESYYYNIIKDKLHSEELLG